MANTINWGQAAVENTIDYGQGATDNTISWGKSQTLSPSGETNITGAGGTPAFTNTLSTTFDGTDDFVNVGNNASLQPSNFTMCVWVKPNTNNSNRVLIHNGAGLYGNTNHGFFLQQSYANYYFKIGDGTTSYTSFNGGLVPNTWQFVAMAYDGVNMKTYLDGILQDTLAVPNITYGTSATWNPFYIGRTSGGSQYMNGNIDEVSLFNTELSQSDITSIYNSGTPTDLTSYSPLGWWRMGDGSTYPTINDLGSGSNNGTMTNMSSANFVTDVPT